MLDNHDSRNLSDVFKELQEIQQSQFENPQKQIKRRKPKARKNFAFHFRTHNPYKKSD